jgi:hypothetical protein
MKLRGILWVALGHFVITVSALTFPVGLLEWWFPIIPWMINSLFWGWAIISIITVIQR